MGQFKYPWHLLFQKKLMYIVKTALPFPLPQPSPGLWGLDLAIVINFIYIRGGRYYYNQK